MSRIIADRFGVSPKWWKSCPTMLSRRRLSGDRDRTKVQRAQDELDLQYALERLPLKERDALRLRLSGWTYREIAAAENSPEPAIRQRVSRAVVKARAILHVQPSGDEY